MREARKGSRGGTLSMQDDGGTRYTACTTDPDVFACSSVQVVRSRMRQMANIDHRELQEDAEFGALAGECFDVPWPHQDLTSSSLQVVEQQDQRYSPTRHTEQAQERDAVRGRGSQWTRAVSAREIAERVLPR